MNIELFFAKKYLRSKDRQKFLNVITFISILGVMVGVMTLIIVLSVMNGFDYYLRDKVMGFSSHIQIMPLGANQKIKNYPQWLKKISKLTDIKGVSPVIEGFGMLKSPYDVSGIRLIGIDKKYDLHVSNLIHNIKTGSYGKLESGKMIAGKYLLRDLFANLKENLSFIPPNFTTTPFGIVPHINKFKICGSFETTVFEYDKSVAYITLQDAAKIFSYKKNEISRFEIQVTTPSQAPKIRRRLEKILGTNFLVPDWTQMHGHLFAALKMEKWVMFIILTLIIFVASLNISSTLIVVVIDKTKEIGILKSMGLAKNKVLKIFLYQGISLSIHLLNFYNYQTFLS